MATEHKMEDHMASDGGSVMPERILRSAERMFRSFGYAKTTVADIARDAGISTAYVYRFYPSKLAICEAVCTGILTKRTDLLWQEARSTFPADDKFRRLFIRITEESVRLMFDEQRLLDMIRVGMDQKWKAVETYVSDLATVSAHILEEGVHEGVFRPIESVGAVADSIGALLLLCSHPVLVNEARNGDPVGRAKGVVSLMLDGLR